MRKHIKYLRYVLKHKRFVYQEGRKLGLGWWQLTKHDWTKFLPSEWRPYVNYFHGDKKAWQARFDAAWLKHQHRCPHHWQHWVLQQDSGAVKVLPMPEKYMREMLADWRGASRAIHGKDDTANWYRATKDGRKLHPETQAWVEQQIYKSSSSEAEAHA